MTMQHCVYENMRFEADISETVKDRDLGPKDHQQEMAYCELNGQMHDAETWPRKVKVMTQYNWGPLTRQRLEIGDTDLVEMEHLPNKKLKWTAV